jgi:long-chain acyl-CoA synthetase
LKRLHSKLKFNVVIKLTLGDYIWQDYETIEKTIEHFSNGLLNLGLKSNDNIVLFCETRREWIESALACFRIKVPGKYFK